MLYIKGISIDWDKIEPHSYLHRVAAIANINTLSFHAPVTFFVGENGSGKSTLLEAIAVAYGFNPEGGTKNYRFSTYDSHSELGGAMRLIRGLNTSGWGYFLRAESFYNVATAEEEYSKGPGGVPQHYHEKSHGESFLAVAQRNFRIHGLYILDEPEAALSPQRQLTLLLEIANCVKEDSQFIIATHSPILLGLPGAEILSFDVEEPEKDRGHSQEDSDHREISGIRQEDSDYREISGIRQEDSNYREISGIRQEDSNYREVSGPRPIAYEDTDSYKVTELFINNREMLLRKLLKE